MGGAKTAPVISIDIDIVYLGWGVELDPASAIWVVKFRGGIIHFRISFSRMRLDLLLAMAVVSGLIPAGAGPENYQMLIVPL